MKIEIKNNDEMKYSNIFINYSWFGLRITFPCDATLFDSAIAVAYSESGNVLATTWPKILPPVERSLTTTPIQYCVSSFVIVLSHGVQYSTNIYIIKC